MKFLVVIVVLISFQCYNKPENANTINSVVDIDQNVSISEVDNTKVSKTEEIVILNPNQDKLDRKELIVFAKTFIGTPYVYARQDPKVGFDCSGYINYVFKNYNIIVPRSSSGFKNFGKKVAIDQVQIGDVLVFKGYQDSTVIGHLGIVCEANGLNSKFVHATSGKAMQVTVSELNSTHYANRFLKAVDVIDNK